MSSSAGIVGGSANQRLLEQRLSKLTEQLVQRLRARLSAIFSSVVSATANSSSSDEADGSNEASINSAFPSRAFAHCLRALVALSRGEVAEEVVAETVTKPLAKPLLTQGRVDDTGGRGSYLGLQSALESLAAQVMAALVLPIQVCADTLTTSGSDGGGTGGGSSSGNGINGASSASGSSAHIDLVVRGVWQPVAALLIEKFPGMFSVGIAGTLSRCYKAVVAFISILECSKTAVGGRSDLASHSAVRQFHDRWKLDLYLQVRLLDMSLIMMPPFPFLTFSSFTCSCLFSCALKRYSVDWTTPVI